MIPKIIHYIWIGSEMPSKIKELIEKNSKFFEGYEIMIWSEKNMPDFNTFAQHAYDEKRWAFVSDYLRFCILQKYGGIYLDTDMEVLKSLDIFLDKSFFAGWDRRGRHIYAGIIGAEVNHTYIGSVVDQYEHIDVGIYPTSPDIMTKCYDNYKDKKGLMIFKSNYFYPLLDGEKMTKEALESAYTNHLWDESWRKYVWLRRIVRRIGLMKFYHYFLFKLKDIK